jgi:hypothetical protein
MMVVIMEVVVVEENDQRGGRLKISGLTWVKTYLKKMKSGHYALHLIHLSPHSAVHCHVLYLKNSRFCSAVRL